MAEMTSIASSFMVKIEDRMHALEQQMKEAAPKQVQPAKFDDAALSSIRTQLEKMEEKVEKVRDLPYEFKDLSYKVKDLRSDILEAQRDQERLKSTMIETMN